MTWSACVSPLIRSARLMTLPNAPVWNCRHGSDNSRCELLGCCRTPSDRFQVGRGTPGPGSTPIRSNHSLWLRIGTPLPNPSRRGERHCDSSRTCLGKAPAFRWFFGRLTLYWSRSAEGTFGEGGSPWGRGAFQASPRTYRVHVRCSSTSSRTTHRSHAWRPRFLDLPCKRFVFCPSRRSFPSRSRPQRLSPSPSIPFAAS